MKSLVNVLSTLVLRVESYFSPVYWVQTWRRFLGAFFQGAGCVWLLVEIVSYLGSEEWVRSVMPGWVMITLPSLWALWTCPPIWSVGEKLKDRDVRIEIKIGDIFETAGAWVVSTNTMFDTKISADIISPDSLQGQLTKNYYDDEAHLDLDLEKALKDQPFKEVSEDRKGKKIKYAIGTIAKIEPKGRTVYLVAIADLNAHGTASGTLDGIIESLGKLWNFVGERGDPGALAVPVLGTGRARIPNGREEMIREIVQSFIAACSETEKKFCEKLTIVIAKNDHRKYEIDMLELRDYLRHVCRYTDFRKKGDTGGGRAV